MNECSWMVSLVVLEVSPGGPPDVPPEPAGAPNCEICKFPVFSQIPPENLVPVAAKPNVRVFTVGTQIAIEMIRVAQRFTDLYS